MDNAWGMEATRALPIIFHYPFIIFNSREARIIFHSPFPIFNSPEGWGSPRQAGLGSEAPFSPQFTFSSVFPPG
jgi:hypothetical protein